MNPADLAANPRRRKVRKRPIPVLVTFAESGGTLETLEGSVPYEAGDAILTGVRGERWPVTRQTFLDRYDPSVGTDAGRDGSYTRRPEILFAVQLAPGDDPVQITTDSGGLLTARAGDWVVQYAAEDFGVVAPDIFEETYEDVP